MYYIFVFFFAIGVCRIFALASACLNRSGKTLNCPRPPQVQRCNKNRTKENWKVKRWSEKTYIQRTFFRICLFIGWMVTILMNHDCCSEKKIILLLEVNTDLSCSRGFADKSSVSLLCVCAKVGQISPEVRLIACQKHFYDASKNINFAFEHCSLWVSFWLKSFLSSF